MAETNEYELQALWWKRILSAFTKRHDRQEIPYVLELLRCVGDQRATETANRAWLLTRRDRADAIAEIRILVAHAEELAELLMSAQCSTLTSARYPRDAGSLQGGQAGHGSPCDASRYARR
jgi:hypothetical protein